MFHVVLARFELADSLPAAQWWLLLIWIVILGAAIGSFLNVVVYRLPAGKSIVHPGSYCPNCRHPIRVYDNIPVISWFLLRGKCRDCGAMIPFGYPVVEGLTALIFLLVGVPEVLLGGANLPVSAGSAPAGERLWLWSIYAYHMLLLGTLLCHVLIQLEDEHVPFRLFVPALVIGYLAPLWDGRLRPVGISGEFTAATATAYTAATAGLIGFAAGSLLGVFAWPAMSQVKSTSPWPLPSQALAAVIAPAVVGLFLGWQAVTLVVCLAAVVNLIATLALRAPKRMCFSIGSVWLIAATLGYIVLWRWTDTKFPFLVMDAAWSTFIAGCVLAISVSVLALLCRKACGSGTFNG